MLGLGGMLLNRTEELYVSNELKLFVLSGQTEKFCRKKSDVSPIFKKASNSKGDFEFTTQLGIIPFGSVTKKALAELLEKALPIEPELDVSLEIKTNSVAAKIHIFDIFTGGQSSVDFCDLEVDVQAKLEKQTPQHKKVTSPYNLC